MNEFLAGLRNQFYHPPYEGTQHQLFVQKPSFNKYSGVRTNIGRIVNNDANNKASFWKNDGYGAGMQCKFSKPFDSSTRPQYNSNVHRFVSSCRVNNNKFNVNKRCLVNESCNNDQRTEYQTSDIPVVYASPKENTFDGKQKSTSILPVTFIVRKEIKLSMPNEMQVIIPKLPSRQTKCVQQYTTGKYSKNIQQKAPSQYLSDSGTWPINPLSSSTRKRATSVPKEIAFPLRQFHSNYQNKPSMHDNQVFGNFEWLLSNHKPIQVTKMQRNSPSNFNAFNSPRSRIQKSQSNQLKSILRNAVNRHPLERAKSDGPHRKKSVKFVS
ncbi:hypothetical protein GJ496_009406 [Pomphorhynchus laevis]|nr:hypothetical protein GJ496_009406 [Pomphorhynchus laevis]